MFRMRILISLVSLSLLSMFPMDVFISSFDDLSRHFRVPYEDAISSISLFTYGFGIGVVMVGFLAEKLGTFRVLIGSLLCLLMANLLSINHYNYDLFLASRFLQGLFSSSFVLSTYIVRNNFEEGESVRIRALISSISAVGITLSPMLGSEMTIRFGWSSIIILACGACVFTTATVFLIREKLIISRQIKSHNNFIFSKVFWIYNLTSTLNFSVHFVFVMLSVKIFTQDFGGTLTEYGIMMFYYGVILFFSNLIISRFNKELEFPNSIYIFIGAILVTACIMMFLVSSGVVNFYYYFPCITMATFFSVYLSNVSVTKAIFSVNSTPLVSSVIGCTRFIVAGTLGWVGFSLGSGMTPIIVLYLFSSTSSMVLLWAVRPKSPPKPELSY
ncbi:MFS domain-containing protein [Vibrio chagasii]|nr:MFS domain-containing protein [Vibrio chagasii]CAH6945722.1 MFS domain-containing protein [Vibrio chagasii]CAH6984208.1 MFS domain-containing protein [Vibrio chagasii]CAH7012678.1 MFS domain-containing protein [Vibrio chagasii]CAH7214794.1 MFS domain-containing protein [Vibrio chagasii]